MLVLTPGRSRQRPRSRVGAGAPGRSDGAGKAQIPRGGRAVSGRRYYEPKCGRFVGRDPKQKQGGLHPYAFTSNNPVNRWDYLGMISNMLPSVSNGASTLGHCKFGGERPTSGQRNTRKLSHNVGAIFYCDHSMSVRLAGATVYLFSMGNDIRMYNPALHGSPTPKPNPGERAPGAPLPEDRGKIAGCIGAGFLS